jgi:long-chain acyl-CoA synthetase
MATAAGSGPDERRTIVAVWRRAVAEGSGPAFLTKEGGAWREVSWREAGERVERLAAGFLKLGLAKGDRAAIFSRTRLEWTLCDYALASIGAIVVPIYQTSSPEECSHIVSDSGTRLLVCENEKQLAALRGESAVAGLEHIVLVEGEAAGATSLAEVEELGRSSLDAQPTLVEEACANVSEADVLTFIYTSGTTGPPKGCIHSHANWVALVDSIDQVNDFLRPDDVALLFLPLAHNFARLVQFAGARIGFTLALCPDIVQVTRALGEVNPTILPSVPRLFEAMYGNVRSRFEEATGVRRRLIDWALGVGRRAAAREEQGQRVSPLLARQRALADKLVFSKIKERLGGRVRLGISGGAPLSRDIIEFFAACGILIVEGYGLTETTSGCNLNRPTRYRFGSVGPALPGIEVATAADGEILVRGPTIFQGYYGREEESAAALTSDGWLLTGDIGSIDADGFLTITDRKKEIIVTGGGKNVSPANLENELKASGIVSQVLVVGDRRPFITALIVPDRAKIGAGKASDEEVRKAIEAVVDGVNVHLGPVEQIKRFAVLPREFSTEEGEVTPTLKLKRRVCEEHFRDDIFLGRWQCWD